MTIPTPPEAPNPLEPDFATKAYNLSLWFGPGVAAMNQSVVDVNTAKLAAQQAANDSGDARDAAITARGQAQGFATAAGVASGLAADERAGAAQERQQAEAARDSARAFAQAAGASVGIAPSLAAKPLAILRVNAEGTGLEATYDVPAGDVKRKSLTAAYTAASADKGALLDCAGTWTLGFAAAATLGNGWWCYVRNIGSGSITADPNASELIDGVLSGFIRQGMTLLIQCDGSSFQCLRIGSHVSMEILTSGTSWICPLGVRTAKFRLTNGGASGQAGNGSLSGPGGAGGSINEFIAPIVPGASYTYAIGAASGTTQITIDGSTYTGSFVPSGKVGKIITSGPYTSSLIGLAQPGVTTPTGFGRGGDGGPSSGSPGSPGGIILEY